MANHPLWSYSVDRRSRFCLWLGVLTCGYFTYLAPARDKWVDFRGFGLEKMAQRRQNKMVLGGVVFFRECQVAALLIGIAYGICNNRSL